MHKSDHEKNMTLYILNVDINENQSLDPSNPNSDTVFPTYTSKIITLAKFHTAKNYWFNYFLNNSTRPVCLYVTFPLFTQLYLII